MQLPVIRRLGCENSEIVELDLNDILYVSRFKDRIIYHTEEEAFAQILTFAEQVRAFERHGFQRIERGYLVQTDKVSGYDEKLSVVLFGSNPNNLALSAPVATSYRKQFFGFAQDNGIPCVSLASQR
ncbi:LytTR family DNA-binding domain-containing protein [Paenibacillus pinihumi]|uniref:LytTR family DNA-binding domain-containing protein n=1 Tax=Paenibacillus pinihumi TaxID=669462 RepID=UPI00040E3B21|nr:LytTR family DNA-binding domain-containing protein [Paenibacillus pinihumi]